MDVLRHRKIGDSFIDSVENGFIEFKEKLLKVLLEDLLEHASITVTRKFKINFGVRSSLVRPEVCMITH